MSGKLYLVPTPIGNLKDITLRALEVLKMVDVVACEDTRQSLKLLNHFNIKKTLISYHKHNENGKSEDIIEMLKEDKNIAIISDAGTPGISDPGEVIVKKCIEENIDFEVLTGATAITTALVYSGLDTTKFIFRGFLPRENKDRKPIIDDLVNRTETLVFYEAPHRILNTLEFLYENLGDRKIAICRELTKMYEDIIRMTLDEAIEYYKENSPRGEYVLVLEGKSLEELQEEERSKWNSLSVEEHIKTYIEEGFSKKDAIKKVAKDREMPKSEVYKYSINI
ncbi:tetrapyrrole (Corrin/Porphyrin) Methylases family protein [Clostridium argentinense CDC 2741]|uniref:Ribosomal RNA small subunit methyltransferase I n=1 Tax=Clostridium argentinense CDC 2741 TaxID=1418104 RepID=A0A0C1R498_9CLOT|nr:16S rRNA (cytidine(1402)-2'-O)-methyltransferase [Clostridium argentinense]ARC83223.1 rRNA (cytidine-2'-O-)-methyltransferase [Clostridium argentinense]KIE45326.1 tetrapyrrole (Corrin/Porphyrin) Methylases family protein [Clostridium argentinense CDC 2741]NFF41528.1 16S rRNA (cytidine(1402)-2'-O)-methyltransferase [Clostridium argentinense]NFP52190.1 16S rRNA (cytidine(1402)-2'-O)-methyltransferase [Clostridium argentinense]NFP74588.1 16S rRNA (cytidine(1402)-2'-O)-methyltransferase [Clostr